MPKKRFWIGIITAGLIYSCAVSAPSINIDSKANSSGEQSKSIKSDLKDNVNAIPTITPSIIPSNIDAGKIIVTELIIKSSEISLGIGKTVLLEAYLLLSDGSTNRDIIWTSEDEKIVQVDSNGNAKRVERGRVKIFIMAKNDSRKTGNITVVDKEGEFPDISLLPSPPLFLPPPPIPSSFPTSTINQSPQQNIETPEKLTEKAINAINSRNYREAVEYANKAIALDSTYGKAYWHRGYSYLELGEYDLAISDYTKSIDLNFSLPGAYNNRGVAYTKKGDCVKANSDYEKACTLGEALGCSNKCNTLPSGTPPLPSDTPPPPPMPTPSPPPSPTSTPTPPPQPQPGNPPPYEVLINTTFNPASLNIYVGDSIMWKNTSTLISITLQSNESLFTEQAIAKNGGTYSYIFTTAGNYIFTLKSFSVSMSVIVTE